MLRILGYSARSAVAVNLKAVTGFGAFSECKSSFFNAHTTGIVAKFQQTRQGVIDYLYHHIAGFVLFIYTAMNKGHAFFDMTCEFTFSRNYPPTINSAKEAEFARRVMTSIVGEDNVVVQEPTMGAEDFSFMLQAKPGAYVFISNGDGAHREMGHGGGPCTLHNPSYDFNDDLIPLGGTYWVELATQWLANPTQTA